MSDTPIYAILVQKNAEFKLLEHMVKAVPNCQIEYLRALCLESCRATRFWGDYRLLL